jgi:L-amino acid N-acyltransferase YncA
MTPDDADQVLAIYQAGLDTGNASFDKQAPDWADFDSSRLALHRLVAVEVAVEGDNILGWVAVRQVSARPVYHGVLEHSVYVSPAACGRGVGEALLRALIASTEAAGVWTLQSGVFPENEASLALHRKCGFRVVGVRERIARRDGVWRDDIMFERRSPVVI